MFLSKSSELRWKIVSYTRHSSRFVPARSGVYLVVKPTRFLGVIQETEILYIGKSRNLQLRMKQHLNPRSEHNKSLNQANGRGKFEFWYDFFSPEQISDAEKFLIQNLNPKYNLIWRKKNERTKQY
jgi:excinuclease UvrABC nuclease subunit